VVPDPYRALTTSKFGSGFKQLLCQPLTHLNSARIIAKQEPTVVSNDLTIN
jgi:hypothetical protein